MARVAKYFMVGLFALVLAGSLLLSGCSRNANEKQLNTLDETQAAVTASNEQVAKLEKEKAELQAKLAEKQDELKKVQAEKEKIQAKLGQ